MRDPRDIIIRPIITEKGTKGMTENKYTFEVTIDANKHIIKKAVEDLFKVEVVRVNTMMVGGKIRGFGRNVGRRKDWKKAIVTLREGDSIPLFEGV